MLTGPISVYQCPNCSKNILQWTLSSGNTFNAKFYSDGRIEAPGLPQSVFITKCQNCKFIFWLDKDLEIDQFEDNYLDDQLKLEKNDLYLNNGFWAELLDESALVYALENKNFRNDSEEKYLRKNLLWILNKKITNYIDYNQHLWSENTNRLIELIDSNSEKELLLSAELYRNMGEFEKCYEILDSISDQNFIRFAYAIFQKCKQKSRMVFQLEI